MFCIIVIKKLNNERLEKFATGVKLWQYDWNETCKDLYLSCKNMSWTFNLLELTKR